ncbi:nickel import ATP-binding protein NikD [Paenibacillus methanolicus]|uniref:Nickel import system ATP-binding protein NikD n=1 Tax=Paenibacillus methanolicus TaxID=582686 RepID=A0A5S5BSA6_9BACL|nr:nickel import ATP-binding protein NikD [Paenibacillus methanolicus]TYP70075.1 nickel transport system ATP-binding protein [Paenibacillus methanolicus]
MTAQLDAVLQVSGLRITARTPLGEKPLVHGVDLEIQPGRVVGLIGESGCGKSITSLSIMQLLDRKTTTIEGSIRLNGRELNGLRSESMRAIRGKEIALIMQNPMNAFSPVLTIGHQCIETIRTHTTLSKKQAYELAVSSLHDVNLPDPAAVMKQYPFQLSGGMLQRVMIATAVCLRPSVIIADEPTTALDVDNQLRVLRQLDRIRSAYGTSILLITHDLGVIAEMADEVAVMQSGRIVEQADVFRLFDHPQHEYTQRLLNARPAFLAHQPSKEFVPA